MPLLHLPPSLTWSLSSFLLHLPTSSSSLCSLPQHSHQLETHDSGDILLPNYNYRLVSHCGVTNDLPNLAFPWLASQKPGVREMVSGLRVPLKPQHPLRRDCGKGVVAFSLGVSAWASSVLSPEWHSLPVSASLGEDRHLLLTQISSG